MPHIRRRREKPMVGCVPGQARALGRRTHQQLAQPVPWPPDPVGADRRELPCDGSALVPSVEHHRALFGRAPRLVATDRGFYSTRGERRLVELGIRHPVLPKPGHRTPQRIGHRRQRWFQRGRAWRAGSEARISRLKNTFGMKRSRYHGGGRLGRYREQARDTREARRGSPLSLSLSPLPEGEGTGIIASASEPVDSTPPRGSAGAFLHRRVA
jgi:hypothetical protein